MNTAQFFIDQESRRHEQNCRSAISRVARAVTMWDVKRAANVVAPSILRGMHLDRHGAGRQLSQAAEKRLDELLMAQLKEASDIAEVDARKAFLGQLRVKEWDALRGEFAQLYRKADMEGRRLLSKP